MRASAPTKGGAGGLQSFHYLEKMLQAKIMGKTSSGGLELLRLFRKFDTNGDHQIDMNEFKQAMHRYNLNLPDSTLESMFRHYDKEGVGHISYYTFIRHMLPNDFPKDDGPGSNNSLMSSASSKEAFLNAQRRGESLTRQAFGRMRSIERVEKMLQRKLYEKTHNGGLNLLRMFRKFDDDKNGVIDFNEFCTVMRKYNLNLPRSTMRAMFEKYDVEKKGHIDYYTFIKRIVPSDFPDLKKLENEGGGLPGMSINGGTRTLERANRRRAANLKKGSLGLKTMAKIEETLRQKIMTNTKGGSRELYYAFQHFDRDGSGDITFDEFEQVIQRHFNMGLSQQELRQLFLKYSHRQAPDNSTSRARGKASGTPSSSTSAAVVQHMNDSHQHDSIHSRIMQDKMVAAKSLEESPLWNRMKRLVCRKWSALLKTLVGNEGGG